MLVLTPREDATPRELGPLDEPMALWFLLTQSDKPPHSVPQAPDYLIQTRACFFLQEAGKPFRTGVSESLSYLTEFESSPLEVTVINHSVWNYNSWQLGIASGSRSLVRAAPSACHAPLACQGADSPHHTPPRTGQTRKRWLLVKRSGS